jgi:hypothetical protein
LSSKLSGWAEVTHPFHPLRGQRFKILKVRSYAGVDTLILSEKSRGSFAISLDWTDRAAPRANTDEVILDFHCLLKISEIADHCRKSKKKVFDK